MKAFVLGLALTLMPLVASAQYVPPQRYLAPTAPHTTTTIDPLSGNAYTTTRQPSGQVDVQGSNLQNGSMWHNTIKPNGDQSGVDAKGNFWSYDSRSGNYMRSDGKMCIGKGDLRTCN